MWRAIRRTDGAVLFQNKRKTEVHAWIRRFNAGFYVNVDFVQR